MAQGAKCTFAHDGTSPGLVIPLRDISTNTRITKRNITHIHEKELSCLLRDLADDTRFVPIIIQYDVRHDWSRWNALCNINLAQAATEPNNRQFFFPLRSYGRFLRSFNVLLDQSFQFLVRSVNIIVDDLFSMESRIRDCTCGTLHEGKTIRSHIP